MCPVTNPINLIRKTSLRKHPDNDFEVKNVCGIFVLLMTAIQDETGLRPLLLVAFISARGTSTVIRQTFSLRRPDHKGKRAPFIIIRLNKLRAKFRLKFIFYNQ